MYSNTFPEVGFFFVFYFFIDLLEISVACLATPGTLAIWIIYRDIYIVDKKFTSWANVSTLYILSLSSLESQNLQYFDK